MAFLRRISFIKAFVLVVGSCLLIMAGPSISSARTRDALLSSEYFKGIDTIVLRNVFGPNAKTILGIDGYQLNGWITHAFKTLFSLEPWVSIGTYSNGPTALPDTSISQESSLIFLVNLSAREEMVNGKPVKTAALSVQFRQSDYHQNPVNFSPTPVTYPFVVPETQEELRQKIEDGVRYLTSYVPAYFCRVEDPNFEACRKSGDLDAPLYQEKLPSAINPVTKRDTQDHP